MTIEVGDSTLLDTWAATGTATEPDASKKNQGWTLGERPPFEYMNWLQNTFGQKINHALSRGVADWDTTTDYLIGAVVNHNGSAWIALLANDASEPTSVNTNWGELTQAGDVQAFSANLTAFLAALTLPTADSDEDEVLATDGAGGIVFRKANVYDEFTFDHAVDGAASTVEFLDLGDYRFIEYDITVDVDTAGGFDVQVSNDNGTTWRTSGYIGSINDGVSQSSKTGSFGLVRTDTDYSSGGGRLFNFNDAAQYTAHRSVSGGDNTRTSSAGGRYNTKEAHDAIRFVFPGTSENGNITVRGHR